MPSRGRFFKNPRNEYFRYLLEKEYKKRWLYNTDYYWQLPYTVKNISKSCRSMDRLKMWRLRMIWKIERVFPDKWDSGDWRYDRRNNQWRRGE